MPVTTRKNSRPSRAYRNSAAPLVALVPLLALLPLCVPQTASAQETSTGARESAGEYQTLAVALAAARPPIAGTVVLSVGAERVKLPPADKSGGVSRLGSSSTIVQIARRFGMVTRAVGAVTAVAPATMVRINTNFQNANFYDGMPQNDVLTLLLASLSASQWQSATGPDGLPLLTLTTPDQKLLLRALLPEGKFSVVPWFSMYNRDYKQEDVRDLTRSLPQARLRLSKSFSVGFPAESGKGQYQSNEIPPSPTAPGESKPYKLLPRQEYGGSQEALYGVRVWETLPNKEKRGQLDFNDPRLNVVVRGTDLPSLKTVGNLIEHLRSLTKIDLFADPRYAALSLTTNGTPGARVSAADLLRAVTLSATATYRRVGPASEPRPAYVLTDDLVGMGTRQSLWYEFERDGDALRAGPVSKAAQLLYQQFGAGSVRAQGDDALLAPPEAGTTSPAGGSTRKPFDQLTPAQQEAVRRVVEQHNQVYKSQPGTASGSIDLYPQVRVELLVPGIEAPIDTGLAQSVGLLFRIPPEVKAAQDAARDEAEKKQLQEMIAKHPEMARSQPPKVPAGTSPANATEKRAFSRMAVLISVRKEADFGAVIAAMKTLDLNELWLDLPLHNARLAQSGEGASQDPDASDAVALLKAALQAADKTGITVLPVVSPFAFAPPRPQTANVMQDAPTASARSGAARSLGAIGSPGSRRLPAEIDAVADRNLLGETSADAGLHIVQRNASYPNDPNVMHQGQDDIRPVPPVYLSPLAPGVLADAQAAVRKLTTVPGVGGLVLRAPDPAGYGVIRGGDDMDRSLLGYNEAMRLAFLREFGADPVDLYTPNYYTGKAKTSVPLQERGERLVSEKYQAWKKFRRDRNQAFLRALGSAAGSVPVVVEQGADSWSTLSALYNSWDDPKLAPRTSYDATKETDLGGQPSTLPQPRSPSRSVIGVLTVSRFLFYMAQSQLQSRGQAAQPSGQKAGASRTSGGGNRENREGLVLDLIRDPAQFPNSREAVDAKQSVQLMQIMNLTPPKDAVEALKVLTDLAKRDR